MAQRIHITFKAAIMAGVAGVALTSTARAQTSAPPAEKSSQTPSANGAAPAQPQALDVVVVTGSRIVRNGYAAPTPVTVQTLEEMQQTTPSNIPDALNKLPVFAANVQNAGSTNALGGGANGTANTYGGNYLNLRNMGPIRTLVLMDGRRVPASTLSGQVDANTLPDQLVQRVDVVTGGASAVYGSDAVTGVVNYILDKNYTGLDLFIQGGVSTYGDAKSYRFGVKGGADLFGGRGHIIASYGQYDERGTAHGSRPWSADIPLTVGGGTAANPFTLITNARTNQATFGGLALSGPFAGQRFTDSGNLAPFNPGIRTGSPATSIGGDGAYFPWQTEVYPTKTFKGFTRFQYDVTDDIQAYVQFNGADSQADHIFVTAGGVASFNIFSNNAFLTPSEQALLNNAGVGSFAFNRWSFDLQALAPLDQNTLNLDVTAGLTGKAWGDFKWDAYYTHGESTLNSLIHNNVYVPNFAAALDSVQSPGGPICAVNLTSSASLYQGCAPLDLFGQNNESKQALNFIFRDTHWKAVNKLDDAAFTLSGDAFNDWAGPVSTAFNFEYRKQSLVETTDANPFASDPRVNLTSFNTPVGTAYLPSTFTGLRPSLVSFSPWIYATQAPQSGSNSVWEVSGETVVPLLKDMPLAKSFDVSGAVRYTDYSSSGVAITWKAGFNWQPVNDVRFRFTESRDIRAPTLYDLYSGSSVTLSTFSDPVSRQTSSVPVLTTGNPNLKPEVSLTTTAGFVYSPSWLPRFKMSVDYFDIEMTNSISSINGTDPTVLAQCISSGLTSPLCAYDLRSTPTSLPYLILNVPANLSKQWTRGVDLDASYNFMADSLVKGAPGRFDLRLLYSYQPVLDSMNVPGASITQAAGVAGDSAHRIAGDINYRVGPWSFFWQTRWQSGQAQTGTQGLVYSVGPLPAIFYHDLSINYDTLLDGHKTQFYFVLDNLLNQYPRIAPPSRLAGAPGAGNPAVAGDDEIGRYFTLGMRFKY